MELAGKVCVVTGGARGLGRALAERFAAEGAAGVVIADLDGEGAVAAAESLGVPALGLRADVGAADDVEAVVARTVEWFGRVDLFCSNAVANQEPGGVEVPDEAWQRAWDVNVMAHLRAARACLPSMLAQGSGYLLPVSSGAGLLAFVHSASYTVTKHAVVSLAEMLAITYGDRGIRVSCVCPGGILTDALARVAARPASRRRCRATPSRRPRRPSGSWRGSATSGSSSSPIPSSASSSGSRSTTATGGSGACARSSAARPPAPEVA